VFWLIREWWFVPYLFLGAALLCWAPWALPSLASLWVETPCPCICPWGASCSRALECLRGAVWGTIGPSPSPLFPRLSSFTFLLCPLITIPLVCLFPLKLPFPAYGLLRMLGWNCIKLTLLAIVNAKSSSRNSHIQLAASLHRLPVVTFPVETQLEVRPFFLDYLLFPLARNVGIYCLPGAEIHFIN